MTILYWLVLGGLVGWNISIMIKHNSDTGPLKNILLASISTSLIGWIGHYVNDIYVEQLNLPILMFSLLGAGLLTYLVGSRRKGGLYDKKEFKNRKS